jgi:hypothetical protein
VACTICALVAVVHCQRSICWDYAIKLKTDNVYCVAPDATIGCQGVRRTRKFCGAHQRVIPRSRTPFLAQSWWRVFRRGNALPVGHGGRHARQTTAARSEKGAGRRGSRWAGIGVIAGGLTRMLQRAAGPTPRRLLLLLQGAQTIATTRNPLSSRQHGRRDGAQPKLFHTAF